MITKQRILIWVLCVSVFYLPLISCSKDTQMKKIVQVTYTSSSGSILPELQWTEKISLSPDGSSFTRTGKIDKSEVNAGIWTISIDESSLNTLFSSLQVLNCKNLKRMEPQDPADGGVQEIFIIAYQNGEVCELNYETGVSYVNGDVYGGLIRKFVTHLSIPVEAANRNKLPGQ